ncbi:GDSL esterase/lipase at1g74460 [Phtheirospermum japonicum]|uniref:GDSL esterase/lipase at1g74460 n=1 Tax=Phtheirospermum japonicum TaxID=374723 RepID=A0A830CF81_9LAMI|nr:GDSL esterase/lipase at1g74460 [Phtheirospermum japonicum]
MVKLKVETLVPIYTIIFSLFLVLGYNCKIVQFIFGDSLSDVGNNNYLSKSLARASLPWYGIDFGNGLPNGRFSNGRTVADIIGDKMGLPRPPAFLDPSLNEDLILGNGVNYASGGGGILNETGSYFVQRFGLYKQIELFQGTQDLIRAKIGETEADKFFKGARYVVALAAAPVRRPTADGVWVRANGLHPASKSVEFIRFGDAYDVVNDLISNPNQYALTCIPASTLCKDRSKYVFWDEYHPSDSANQLIANEMIKKLGFKPVNQADSNSPAPSIAQSADGD